MGIGHINFSKNNIRKIPKWIQQLKNLKFCNFSQNDVKELPEVEFLAHIRKINLTRNPLPILDYWHVSIQDVSHAFLSPYNDWYKELAAPDMDRIMSVHGGQNSVRFVSKVKSEQVLSDLCPPRTGPCPFYVGQKTDKIHKRAGFCPT